jgi:hypothetical protein
MSGSEQIGDSGEDKSREGISMWKILWHPLQLLTSNAFNRAIVKVSSFEKIDLDLIEELRGKINGVILDVDETMGPHHGDPFPQNIEHVRQMIASGRQVVIFSNMKKSDRYAELEAMGVKVITSKYPKPDPRGFIECCQVMGLDPSEVVMIGDNFGTDGGCVNAGIDFIHVDPIKTEESVWKSVKRLPQTLSRSLFKYVSDIHDDAMGRLVLRDEHFGEGMSVLDMSHHIGQLLMDELVGDEDLLAEEVK